MFKHLKKYDHIIVSGVPRSGTRICANMIAYDTGYTLSEEQIFHKDSLEWVRFCIKTGKTVVQWPGVFNFSPSTIKIALDCVSNVVLVLIKRKPEDIIESRRRIKFSLDKMNIMLSEINHAYGKWENCFRNKWPNYVEVDYDSLSKHPLFIKKENRNNFALWQTEVEQAEARYKEVTL